MREVLTSFEAQGAAGELAFVLSVLVPLFGLLVSVYGFTRRAARKRYNKVIDGQDALKLENKTLKENANAQAKRLGTLEQNAPDTFIKSVEHAERDGNTGPASMQSERYLGFHANGLARAYSLRMNAEIANAAKDGGLSYANALAFAQAARLSAPDNERLAQIIPELRQAVAVSAGGAQVKIKDVGDGPQASFEEYEALHLLTQRQRDLGNVLLYLESAEALSRIARRLFPAGSVEVLNAENCIADAYFYNGQTQKAITKAETLLNKIPDEQRGDAMTDYDTVFGNCCIILSLAYAHAHQYDRAAKYIRRKLDRIKGRASEDLVLTAEIQLFHYLIILEKDPKLADKAIVRLEKLESLGIDGPELGSAQNRVSEIATALRRSEDALRYAKMSLKTHENHMSPTDLNVLTAKRVVGKCLGNLGRHQDALDILVPLAKQEAEILPEDHYDRYTTLNLIKSDQDRLAKANQHR